MRLHALAWVLLLLWSTRREAKGVCPEIQKSGVSQAVAAHLDGEHGRWLARRSHIAGFTAMAGSSSPPPAVFTGISSVCFLIYDIRQRLLRWCPLSDGGSETKSLETSPHCTALWDKSSPGRTHYVTLGTRQCKRSSIGTTGDLPSAPIWTGSGPGDGCKEGCSPGML